MRNGFPEDFLWGAATSAYQVEGDNFHNDWWEWEQAGNTEPSGKACDHYNRFREDFRLAKELGHNVHRLGIEWSRLEKDEGVWDASEWDHYKAVLDELLDLGIEPMVTLHHFTLPLWLSRKGSWLNENADMYFIRFAVKAIEELGSRARYWITINEPNILAILAYYQGKWPPCRTNFGEALTVLRNMLKAHTGAYSHMRRAAMESPSIRTPIIGLAKAVTAFHPLSPYSPLDRFYTYLRSKFHNHAFISSIINGRVYLPGLRPEKLPSGDAADFIGLNYYFRHFIYAKRPFKDNPMGEVYPPELLKTGGITDMGWEIYPKGIYEVVKSFCRYRKPIMITENGMATTDDSVRTKFIKDHLKYLLKAINEGAPVTGYIHWSLLDNFEWSEGYGKRFGLVGVDYSSQKRTVKDSARYLASVIKTRRIAD
jgi:beta-glucosidase